MKASDFPDLTPPAADSPDLKPPTVVNAGDVKPVVEFPDRAAVADWADVAGVWKSVKGMSIEELRISGKASALTTTGGLFQVDLENGLF